jgi:CheY-like chemotaxis protein
MRNALRRTLGHGGLTVQAFASGPDFLAGYRPTPAACLLLDMKMPEMTGLELQAILNERRIDLPVIFLTGAADVPAAVKAMKAGAADFLEKPFDNEVLVARIHQCIAAHALRHLASDDGDRYEHGFAQLTPREAGRRWGSATARSTFIAAASWRRCKRKRWQSWYAWNSPGAPAHPERPISIYMCVRNQSQRSATNSAPPGRIAADRYSTNNHRQWRRASGLLAVL